MIELVPRHTTPAVRALWATAAFVHYIAGSLDRDRGADVIGLLRHDRVVSVGLTPRAPSNTLLPPDFDEDGADIGLEDREPGVDLALRHPASQIAPGGDRSRTGAAGPWMVASLATALDHGLGYCLLDGEQAVA